MKVKDIMRRPVVTISQEATLREAVALLSSAEVSGLPVLDADGNLVGIITEHDVIKTLLPTYEDLLSSNTALLDPALMENRAYQVRDTPVSSIMTRKVVTLEEDDSLLKAASTVILKKVKRLPVVRGKKPVGIVSRIDIVGTLIKAQL